MNINKFNTVGYFISHYFNSSMDWSELESCIEDFLIRENEESIKAFRKEIETMHMLNDSDLIREVAYRLGNRGMPADKALNMIKLLYIKTWKENK